MHRSWWLLKQQQCWISCIIDDIAVVLRIRCFWQIVSRACACYLIMIVSSMVYSAASHHCSRVIFYFPRGVKRVQSCQEKSGCHVSVPAKWVSKKVSKYASTNDLHERLCWIEMTKCPFQMKQQFSCSVFEYLSPTVTTGACHTKWPGATGLLSATSATTSGSIGRSA